MKTNFIILFSLIVFITSACQQREEKNYSQNEINHPQDFFFQYYPLWVSTFHIEILNYHFINSQEFIYGPEGTWQKLLKISYLGSQSSSQNNFQVNSQQAHCVFYKIPSFPSLNPHDHHQKIQGELKVVPIHPSQRCDDDFLKPHHALKKITNLMVVITNDQAQKILPLGNVPSYHLSLYLGIYNQKLKKSQFHTLHFPLYNIRKGKLKFDARDKILKPTRLHQRYHSGLEQRLIPGLIISSINGPDMPKEEPKLVLPMLGHYNDDYAENTAVKCHEVNDSCETTQEFTCDRCRYGWYEVVGKECAQGGDKYCGVNLCGGPNRPACSRGEILSQLQGMQQCQNGGLAGFCHHNSETFCDGNNTLICF